MRRLLVLGWIFVGGFAVAAPPNKLAPVGKTTKAASIEGVTEYRLANGARALLFPEASRPTVTINMTVLVGSRHEGYGESGMAHLLEHMVFKGTPSHPLVPKALARSRRQLQRHHRTTTAPTISRPCLPPTKTSSSASRSNATGSSTASSRAKTWRRK